MSDDYDKDAEWARWLHARLTERGWVAADLVKASGTKENGRPVIDQPTMTRWLGTGAEPPQGPGARLAAAAARALGIDPTEALVVAGIIEGDHVTVVNDDGSESFSFVVTYTEREQRLAEAFLNTIRAEGQ